MLAQAQGLVCHANYWVKCAAGEAGHWLPNWPHIFISIGAAVVVIYIIMRIFGIKL